MKISRIAGTLAVLITAGAAHAQASPIPGNQIDDFGPFFYANPPAAPVAVAVSHASPIPANQIDDFGSLAPEQVNEELGAAGAEPGIAAKATEEKAAIEAYSREQFIRSCWRATP